MFAGHLEHPYLKGALCSVHLEGKPIEEILSIGREAVQGRLFKIKLLSSGSLGGPVEDEVTWAFGEPPMGAASKWLSLDWIFSSTHGSERKLACLLRVKPTDGGDLTVEVLLPCEASGCAPRPETPGATKRAMAAVRSSGCLLVLTQADRPPPPISTARLGTSIQRAVAGLLRVTAKAIEDSVGPQPRSGHGWDSGGSSGGGGGGGDDDADVAAKYGILARPGEGPDVLVFRLWHVRLERPHEPDALWPVLAARAALQRLGRDWPLLADAGHPARALGWLRALREADEDRFGEDLVGGALDAFLERMHSLGFSTSFVDAEGLPPAVRFLPLPHLSVSLSLFLLSWHPLSFSYPGTHSNAPAKTISGNRRKEGHGSQRPIGIACCCPPPHTTPTTGLLTTSQVANHAPICVYSLAVGLAEVPELRREWLATQGARLLADKAGGGDSGEPEPDAAPEEGAPVVSFALAAGRDGRLQSLALRARAARLRKKLMARRRGEAGPGPPLPLPLGSAVAAPETTAPRSTVRPALDEATVAAMRLARRFIAERRSHWWRSDATSPELTAAEKAANYAVVEGPRAPKKRPLGRRLGTESASGGGAGGAGGAASRAAAGASFSPSSSHVAELRRLRLGRLGEPGPGSGGPGRGRGAGGPSKGGARTAAWVSGARLARFQGVRPVLPPRPSVGRGPAGALVHPDAVAVGTVSASQTALEAELLAELRAASDASSAAARWAGQGGPEGAPICQAPEPRRPHSSAGVPVDLRARRADRFWAKGP